MIIALALLCMIPAAAENVSTADSLYNKKQYEEALRVYQDVQKRVSHRLPCSITWVMPL